MITERSRERLKGIITLPFYYTCVPIAYAIKSAVGARPYVYDMWRRARLDDLSFPFHHIGGLPRSERESEQERNSSCSRIVYSTTGFRNEVSPDRVTCLVEEKIEYRPTTGPRRIHGVCYSSQGELPWRHRTLNGPGGEESRVVGCHYLSPFTRKNLRPPSSSLYRLRRFIVVFIRMFAVDLTIRCPRISPFEP